MKMHTDAILPSLRLAPAGHSAAVPAAMRAYVHLVEKVCT